MTQTPQKSIPNLRVRNICIVLAVTSICFLVGGGWHLICNPNDIYGYFHACYSVREILGGYVFLYILGGGLTATIGAAGAVIVLKISSSKKQS